MDAMEYLREQHREIESLFDQLESARRTATRRRLCRKLLDLVAVHAAIEERILYPSATHAAVEPLLARALEDHLRADAMAAGIVEGGAAGDAAAAKLALLRDLKRRHADAEERELFPKMRELLTPEQRSLLGERLSYVAEDRLEAGAGARERITARRALA